MPIADAAVRAVLAHYKWDWQKVVTEYCEMDPIKFFAEAKVSNPFTAEEITSVCNDTDLTVCKICYDDEPGVSISMPLIELFSPIFSYTYLSMKYLGFVWFEM